MLLHFLGGAKNSIKNLPLLPSLFFSSAAFNFFVCFFLHFFNFQKSQQLTFWLSKNCFKVNVKMYKKWLPWLMHLWALRHTSHPPSPLRDPTHVAHVVVMEKEYEDLLTFLEGHFKHQTPKVSQNLMLDKYTHFLSNLYLFFMVFKILKFFGNIWFWKAFSFKFGLVFPRFSLWDLFLSHSESCTFWPKKFKPFRYRLVSLSQTFFFHSNDSKFFTWNIFL